MGYCLGNAADLTVSENNFFWLDADIDIDSLPEDAPNGSLAVSIPSGKRWVKNSVGVWAPLGG